MLEFVGILEDLHHLLHKLCFSKLEISLIIKQIEEQMLSVYLIKLLVEPLCPKLINKMSSNLHHFTSCLGKVFFNYVIHNQMFILIDDINRILVEDNCIILDASQNFYWQLLLFLLIHWLVTCKGHFGFGSSWPLILLVKILVLRRKENLAHFFNKICFGFGVQFLLF